MSKKRSDVYFPFGPLLLYLFILQFRWFAFINIMIQVWQRRVLTYIRLEQRGYMRLVYAQVLLVISFFNMIYLILTFSNRFGINILTECFRSMCLLSPIRRHHTRRDTPNSWSIRIQSTLSMYFLASLSLFFSLLSLC